MVWPGSGQVLRCLGPGFAVLARWVVLGEEPIIIMIIMQIRVLKGCNFNTL